jgi:TIR domain
MKVFISWSGDLSKRLAAAIHKWLPDTLQYVKPYFTPDDIEKGAKWDQEISKELEASNFCIIVLTRESLDSKWIMFEAGAISKSIERARLCTVLFGIGPTDVQGPLERFQATEFSKEEIHKLLKTINSNAKEEALPDATLDRVFEKWWPDLERDVREIMREAGSSAKVEVRDQRDLLQEVLGLTRVMAEQQSQVREMVGKMAADDRATDQATVVIGKLISTYIRSQTDETHTPKVTSTVFDVNKPNEQPDKSPDLPFEQKGNVDLAKPKDNELKK